MPKPLPLRALNHIALLTRRLDESKAFYCDVLGFGEVARPNFNFAGAWLSNYGLMIHLIYGDAAGGPEGEIQSRTNHLALETDDIDQVEKLLQEHGVTYVKRALPDRPVTQLFFRDPDGHHIEVGNYSRAPQ